MCVSEHLGHLQRATQALAGETLPVESVGDADREMEAEFTHHKASLKGGHGNCLVFLLELVL